MPAIRESIELVDSFSPIINNIVASVNYTVSAMEQMRLEMEKPMHNEALKSARAQVDDLNDIMRQTGDATKAAREAMEKGASGTKKLGEESQRAAGGISSAADAVSNLIVAAGGYKVLGAIKDGFISAANAAMEYESAVTGIYKTVDGTQQQLQGLSDTVKTMSTEIPSSTTEIAGIMESAGQLGIATANVESFSRTMIDLANSTNLTSEAAASSLAKFANITQMDPSAYQNLGSTIVDLGNNFATTESDIVSMATRLASAANLAGMSQSDIMALATAMSSVGIEADAGGSSMSKLITQIQLAVETGSGLNEFASVANMSAEQFSNAFGNNAVSALQAFITGLNDAQRNGASTAAIL